MYCAGTCLVAAWLGINQYPLLPTIGGLLMAGAAMMRLGALMDESE